MIRRMKKLVFLIRNVQVFSFIYLNYFCKGVVRTDRSRIIPYKHAVIEIAHGAKIFLAEGDIEVGCDRIKDSKAETRIRLRKQAVWSSQGGCRLSYGVTIEVLPGALLDSKFFTMNSNSVLISAEKITLGQDVMIARNVVIYDSDFHSILNQDGKVSNMPKPVIIGDHVWLGTNVIVLKGAKIGNDSIISAHAVLSSNIPEQTIYGEELTVKMRKNIGGWERRAPHNE